MAKVSEEVLAPLGPPPNERGANPVEDDDEEGPATGGFRVSVRCFFTPGYLLTRGKLQLRHAQPLGGPGRNDAHRLIYNGRGRRAR